MPAPWMKTMAGAAAASSRPPVAAYTWRPSTLSSMTLALLCGRERLAQIVGEIAGVLEPNRQPHQLLADAGLRQVLAAHLLVRRAGRMNDQRLGIADVGKM